MGQSISRVLIVFMGAINLVVSGYFLTRSWEVVRSLPEIPRLPASIPAEGGEAHGDTLGVKPHAEVPGPGRSWVTFEEMFVNVLSDEEDVHTLAFKLELELFDESARHLMEERQAVVKNAIIEIARTQSYDSLKSLAGKLYFKEALVGQVNQTVKFPLLRDIHLASFSLR